MKMTRSKLKGIIKECLVEILSEGIGHDQIGTSSTRTSNDKRAALEAEKKRLEEHRRSLDNKIESTVSNLTDDSLMREILADTARTTLQEQMSHDRSPGMNGPSGPGIDLDNIFTGAANNWSQLAFSDKK